MPNINDPEPIEVDGQVIYESELDRVKKMYGFLPRTPYGLDMTPRELAEQQIIRQRHKINKAK